MAVSDVVTQRAFVRAPRRGAATRLLEDERWLAAALLLPTVILLGLFIAYPFVEGVWLSVTDARVGVPGHFVGLAITSRCCGTTASSASPSGTPSSIRRSPPSSSSASVYGLRCCSIAISGARRSPARSFFCPSSSRRCCRPSPGNGCSTRPLASSTGRCSSSA